MRFTVQPIDLKNAFSAVKRVMNSKNRMPVLDNIKIEPTESDTVVRLIASDGDDTIVAGMTVEDAADLHPVLIPADFLGNYVGVALSSWPVTFEFDDNGQMTISDLIGEFNVVCGEKVDDYPILKSMANANVVSVPVKEFIEASSLAMGYTVNDLNRPVLSGVNYDVSGDEMRIGASDAKRLFYDIVRGVKADSPVSFTMSKKMVSTIVSLFGDSSDLKIAVTDKLLRVEREGLLVLSTLIEGKYPRIASVIPKTNDRIAVVDCEKLESAIKRVLIAADSSTRQIIATFDGSNSVKIETESAAYGRSAQITCTTVSQTNFAGELKIGFRGNFMLEILSSLKGNSTITVKLMDHARPILLLPNPDSDRIILLTPMQILDRGI